MKVGMNLLLWTDKPNPSEHLKLLQSIKEWGFDGVELAADSMDAGDAKAFGLILKELGLGCTAIAALDASVADPASRDSRLRDNALATLKQAISNTHLMGAEVLCGPLFQGLGRFTGQGPQTDEWNYAVETLREAGRFAAELGVRLALEPINRFEMYLVNTLEEGVRFVKQVGLPNVGLLADTHHGNIEELNVPDAWRQAAAHIIHVHISENNRGVPGSGHAVTEEIFDVLKEIGYDGWLTIEAFGQQVPGLISRLHLWRDYSEHPDDAARLGVQHIRKHLA
ncbi:sugar phosphate isomerase/epimerase family protein [Paenibacillus radicis (ex Gao et al. 2016)]|uniref:Isomerase n=1 Tax=Paenibacillus radicis (ex Gao et al. 2016) TaxID=1737354 RepID=A0A917LVP4_9BACL|nr:sugar phosphate isomerase/epimerase family protein [Paenibacillus radicis (ex Gao et al. 2016)]GGG60644.1 isomerase [Paenibacillus radicis (ex Gao et al. 2016)]